MNLLTVNQIKTLPADGYVIIDIRPSAVFVNGFIPNSIHLPYTENFIENAGLLLEPENKLILITETGMEGTIAKALHNTGFATVTGIVEGGYEAWQANEANKDIIIEIDAEEFELDFNYDEFYLIDVRPEEEYAQEHFEYAENLPLSEIEEAIPDLSIDLTYYIYGNTFEDAALAASLFKRAGFNKLRVVNQGYQALKATAIPVVKKKKTKTDNNFSDN